MKITNLKLTNFRNYEKLNLHFSNYKNIIIGNNGLGKTNIVEAIYYLSITKSFRTNNQEVLIRENSDFAVIEATVLNKIKNKYRVVITKDGKKIKKMYFPASDSGAVHEPCGLRREERHFRKQ